MEHAFAEEPTDASHLSWEEACEPRRDPVHGNERDQDRDEQRRAGEVHDAQVGEERAAEGDVPADDEENEYDKQVEQPLRDDDADGA